MKTSAEIVIIGGGAVGCSVAYHLSLLGKTDVLLLEKSGLTRGCTWHAAGLVGQLRGRRNLTRLLQYSAQLYDRLEAETGQATGWHRVGSLRVASSKERWREIRRTATTARSFGFELHLISALEARELFPLMDPANVEGAAWIPTDGYVDPSSLTRALASGARERGVTITEGVRVTDMLVRKGRITDVVTDQGTVSAEIVVNAAGLWARDVGKLIGVDIPAGVVEHQYMVTEKSDAISAALPTFRDPDHLFYLKPEPGALALGGWEGDSIARATEGMPWAFEQELYPSNFDRFEQIALPAAGRLPILNEIGVRTLINGPIPVTPDGEPIIGLAPGLQNFFIACGFTAGIAGCGGAGKVLANWIVEGDPGMDLWSFDIRRFGPHHNSGPYLAERCVETYGHYYQMHWPGEEAKTGRRIRLSPLYDRLKTNGACYGSKFGWERPNWFAPDGVAPVDEPDFDAPNWDPYVAEEHRTVRERVGLIDQTSFAKFELEGAGATEALQRLCANNVDREVGSVIYTQMCNHAGGIEADLTITRLGEARYYIVTGSGFGIHDADWIRRHLPRDGAVELKEVTSMRAVINVCGPNARALLASVTTDDVSDVELPYMTARWLQLGYARLLALRLTYVGELGYELHMDTEYAVHVYDRLRRAGESFGAADVGYRAIDSLRLEKGYRYWSTDITPDDNPFEAGLGFCVDLKKGDFIGSEALKRIRTEGVRRRLCCFTLAHRTPVYGGEAVFQDGEAVGVTTSGGFGHTVGKSIVFAYVETERLSREGFEVEAFCERVPATRHAGSLYDPDRKRITAA